jgi:hypothetical protein
MPRFIKVHIRILQEACASPYVANATNRAKKSARLVLR